MNDLAHKCMGFAGLEVKDPERGIVEAVVARTGITDHDGDVFLPGAFGERKVRVSEFNHRSWPHRGGLPPVGVGTIREDGNNVVAEMQFFLATSAGREAFETVKGVGDMQEWSYGWLPGTEKLAKVSDEMRNSGVRRAIKEVPVVEVSPVMMGASIGTRTVGVKECQTCGQQVPDDEPEESEAEENDGPTPCELKADIEREVERFRAIVMDRE